MYVNDASDLHTIFCIFPQWEVEIVYHWSRWHPVIKGYLSNVPLHRDHFVHGCSQWETTLRCNVVSHWLNPPTQNDPCYKTVTCFLSLRSTGNCSPLDFLQSRDVCEMCLRRTHVCFSFCGVPETVVVSRRSLIWVSHHGQCQSDQQVDYYTVLDWWGMKHGIQLICVAILHNNMIGWSKYTFIYIFIYRQVSNIRRTLVGN